MALTNQQVQAAYLAITGRPAEGSAVTWASASFADVASLVSSIIDIRKGGDFSNNKETFVENLYQNILGRASDAEGKEYWLKALNDGASYAQVAQNFINVVLGQSQTEDLYTLQNKLGIAEQISAQINTFQGGAAAEATLKALMSTVNVNTTIDSLKSVLTKFEGQNVNVQQLVIDPASKDKITGNKDNASVFSLSLDLDSKDEKTMKASLTGSTKYEDTLNVNVTASEGKAKALSTFGTYSNIENLNITADSSIDSITHTPAASVKNFTFTGDANVSFTAPASLVTLATDAGSDAIVISSTNTIESVDLGAGDNDQLTLSGSQTALTSVEGVEKLVLTNTAEVNAAILDSKDYNMSGSTAFSVDADGTSSLDLSQLKNVPAVEVTIKNVSANSTITLSKGTGAETIKLASSAFTGGNNTELTISGVQSGDKIDFGANNTIKAFAEVTANNAVSITAGSTAITASDTNGALGIVTTASGVTTAADALTWISKNVKTSSGNDQFATAGAKAIVAFSDTTANHTSLFYLDDINGNKKLDDGEVFLLANINNLAVQKAKLAIGSTDGIVTLA